MTDGYPVRSWHAYRFALPRCIIQLLQHDAFVSPLFRCALYRSFVVNAATCYVAN